MSRLFRALAIMILLLVAGYLAIDEFLPEARRIRLDRLFDPWNEESAQQLSGALPQGEGSASGRTLEVFVLSQLADEAPDAAANLVRFYFESDQTELIEATVIRALRHQLPVIRKNAAEVIGLMRWKSGREPLERRVQDPSPQVARMVVSALRIVGNEQSLFALVLALKSASWEVRREAAEALGHVGGPGAVRYLWTALGDPDPLVRSQAGDSIVLAARSENADFLRRKREGANDFQVGVATRALEAIAHRIQAESEGKEKQP